MRPRDLLRRLRHSSVAGSGNAFGGDGSEIPKYSFGQPAPRGVRTEVLAEEFRAGAPGESIAELYVLTAEQVDEALRFEMIAANSRVA